MPLNRYALVVAIAFGCLLAPVAETARAQDAKPDAPSERVRRGGRVGMPLPPDWPRAGGFGPGGQGAERPMIEGLVLEGMIPSSFGRRELTAEDLARVLAVAREVSPEWGTAIEERIKTDPAQVKSALRTSGRRLLGLAALKERAPKVFEVKVAELRAQAETERTAVGLRALEGLSEGSSEASAPTVEAGEKALADAAARQVEATLAARRAELDALEERLKRLRAEVEADAARRAELAAEVAERAKKRAEEPRRDGKRE